MPQNTLLLLQILAQAKAWRLADLAARAGLDLRDTRRRLDLLRESGLVACADGRWTITDAGRASVEDPTTTHAVEPYYGRLWRALRQLVTADLTQLVIVCQQGERQPVKSAARYLAALEAVGLIVRAGRETPPRYALIPGTDPGPLAPRLRTCGGQPEVWEPNTGRRLPLPPTRRRTPHEDYAA